jgi:hypothetical protein
MNIDTYDTLAMVRPTASRAYDLKWMEELARAVAGGAGASVARKRDLIGAAYVSVMRGETELCIYYSDAPHVLIESNEIAEGCNGSCHGCASRFELSGTDLALVLMNDHQLICERLNATGDFVLFSAQGGLFFGDQS